jgi:hypothetical protein
MRDPTSHELLARDGLQNQILNYIALGLYVMLVS